MWVGQLASPHAKNKMSDVDGKIKMKWKKKNEMKKNDKWTNYMRFKSLSLECTGSVNYSANVFYIWDSE